MANSAHGGFDGGAVAPDGTVEKDINLKITTYLSEMLKFSGYDVVLTRTDDTGTEDDSADDIRNRKVSDLNNRLKLLNSYPQGIFVSIHLNKFTTSTVSGAQVFYSKNHSDSANLGECIQRSVVSLLQPENERVIKQGTKSTFLLHYAEIPAVIVECGFLSNSTELALLKTDDYQRKMAFAVFCGITDYSNNKG